ncbi:MAG: EFR1 family ferrodoxin [Lachnospiraceae bacterium]|nr:EFR1 family ferrodoxin [Lachnospiraceae bacterium]
MKLYQITFSPTGGTENVASALASAWEMPAARINLLKKQEEEYRIYLSPEDVCIVAVPAYGGRVPAAAAVNLKRLKGNGARAIPVAVFGNRKIDDTLAELQDLLEESGFVCIAGVEAAAEHSLVRQFGKGRPDAADRAELKNFAAKIKSMLEDEKAWKESAQALKLPGNRPYREAGGAASVPIVTDTCVECGLCSRECPVEAIAADDPKKTDKERCMLCMHCEAVCPMNARMLPKEMVDGLRQRLKDACEGRKENRLYLET